MQYSNIEDFRDNEVDENGKLVRPYIYLWDDNFLASPKWKEMLLALRATGRPFQFRQGLDERLLAQSPHGEEMAELEISLPPKEEKSKFYLFCGFQQGPDKDKEFQQDIAQIFMRIKVLMSYGCLGYIMRHEDYKQAPQANIYVQIARWCNQPGFYRNMSFWEFCYKNQTYWEKTALGLDVPPLKTYEEFLEDYNNGYYADKKLCGPLKTIVDFLNAHKAHERLFLSFFNMRKRDLENPALWERK